MVMVLKMLLDIQLDTFKKLPLRKMVKVPIIAVYKNPTDYPDKYVARLWDIGKKATYYIVVRDSLDEIRSEIPLNFQRIPPHINDDPVLIETWL